ncbi:hypothetical protein DJ530_01050 [Sulfolobus sp. E1]|nr:hypothetical protein DJ530_01050 [Sulfolobus sp. E1]
MTAFLTLLRSISNPYSKSSVLTISLNSISFGVLIPLSQKILNAAEKGIIKLTTSGLDGDTLLQANVVLITASDKNDLVYRCT